VYPNPTFEQLSKPRAELFMKATLLEMSWEEEGTPNKDLPELSEILGIQILDKRIDVMKLPIKFTAPGKMAALAYVDSPGKMIVLLIDCLTAYEGQTVGVAKLVSLYPDGFYTQECFEKYVDELIKPKKIKWAEIY
jgi:hypothetical protein